MPNWTELYHDLFEIDDGALPGITISGLTSEDIVRIYAHLRSSGEISSVDAHFWHQALRSDQPIDSVPNPAELVIRGEASSFHLCFRGLAIGPVEIPELGIFVFEQSDCVELDYRRGPEWTAAKVEALFHLLLSIKKMASNAKVALDSEVADSETAVFAKAWEDFLAETLAQGL